MNAETQPRPLEIIDTTFREGPQSPLYIDTKKYFLVPEERIVLTQTLYDLGVRYFEVFVPMVSPLEKESLDALKEFRETHPDIKLLAHARCHPLDIESALSAGVDGVNLYMGTSPESIKYNHHKPLEYIAKNARSLIEDIRRHHPNVQIRFSGEDAFRTSMKNLYRVYDVLAPFVDRFGMPDTVGAASPDQVRRRVSLMRRHYPTIDFEGHFHNDLGQGAYNAEVAHRAGMRYINTTILGVGERSGVTSLTALLLKLYCKHPDYVKDYTIKLSYPLNVTFADMLRIQVPWNEPVSLTNRTHTAGVHAAAVLVNEAVYEAHKLALFGVDQRILLGPLSGWHITRYYVEQMLGFEPVGQDVAMELNRAYKAHIMELNDTVSPSDLLYQCALDMHLPLQEQGTSPFPKIEDLSNGAS